MTAARKVGHWVALKDNLLVVLRAASMDET